MTREIIVSLFDYILSLIVAIVIGAIGSYIATVLYERRKRLAKSVAEREVFDLGSRNLVVVVPHRGREADSIIPRVAVEDVLAMKNIQEIVARIHPDMRIHIRDASRLTENDRKGNIITPIKQLSSKIASF